MWIEVRGGVRPSWVEAEECHLANGDSAFVNEAGSTPSLPEWLEAPVDSIVRKFSDLRPMGYPAMESRSMRATTCQILAFYGDLIERGQLARTKGPHVVRLAPGFSAEDANYFFELDVYEHKDLAHWTIQLAPKVRQHKAAIPATLEFVSRNDERCTLRHPATTDEYWAPAASVRDSEPPDLTRESCRSEPLIWSSLPGWCQFGLDSGRFGEVHRCTGENGADEWNASISTPLVGDPRMLFAHCLDRLDDQGFDGSGIQRPDRSYSVSILQWGHSLNAFIQSEAGDQASATVLNTLGRVVLFLRYSPPRASSPLKPAR